MSPAASSPAARAEFLDRPADGPGAADSQKRRRGQRGDAEQEDEEQPAGDDADDRLDQKVASFRNEIGILRHDNGGDDLARIITQRITAVGHVGDRLCVFDDRVAVRSRAMSQRQRPRR